MPTYNFTKQEFIEFIETKVQDNEEIIMSNIATEWDGITVTHQFSDMAFRGVDPAKVFFGNHYPISIQIAKKKECVNR